MTRNNYSIGLLLIGIAVILILGKLGVFAVLGKLFWPLIVLGIGALLHALHYIRLAPSSIVVPGGALITYALIFLFCNLFGWSFMKYLWPGFLFGIAVGLYELYVLDRHSPRSVLTVAIIIALVSAVLFAMTLLFTLSAYIIALLLIAVGLGFIFWRPRTW